MIQILLLALKSLRLIVPALLALGRFGSYIFKFIRILATKPLTWVIMSFAPLIDLVIGLFTGKSIMTKYISQIFMQIVNKILQFTFNIDLQTMVNQLPGNVLQISCYLGANEAIQIIFDGLITAMSMLIILQLNLVIARLNWEIVLRSKLIKM